MKIGHVITRMDWGGPPDIVRLVCALSDSEKHDMHLIVGETKNPSVETKKFLNDIKDKVFFIPQLKRDVSPINDIVAFVKLWSLFRKEKFDIVHTHTAKAGALGRFAAWMAGVHLIVHTSHGHNFYGYFGRVGSKIVVFVEKFLSLFTDKMMALTQLEKNDYVDLKICKPEKIHIVYSGVDLDKFGEDLSGKEELRKEYVLREDEVLVGMIGRLEDIKGPIFLLEAIRLLKEKNVKVKFLLVGEGSLRSELEHKCCELDISERVIFAGWRDDIAKLMPGLDILVLPSLNEAVGRVLIEAGACGIPCVATRVGGIPEIIKDNETGVLVSSRSPQEIAEKIVLLAENVEKRKIMGEAAKKWIDEKFSARKMVSGILNLYAEQI